MQCLCVYSTLVNSWICNIDQLQTDIICVATNWSSYNITKLPASPTLHKYVATKTKYVDTWTLNPYVIAEHLILKPCALICCYNSLHFSGKAFHSRDLLPFSHKSIIEVHHWCWLMRSGSQSVFIPKVLDGVEVRALCRPIKFFHNKLGKLFVYWPVYGVSVMLKQERAFITVNCHSVVVPLSRISLYAVAIMYVYPSLELRCQTLKNIPRPKVH